MFRLLKKKILQLPTAESSDGQEYVQLYDVLETIRRFEKHMKFFYAAVDALLWIAMLMILFSLCMSFINYPV